jgi:hypothetical protein
LIQIHLDPYIQKAQVQEVHQEVTQSLLLGCLVQPGSVKLV